MSKSHDAPAGRKPADPDALRADLECALAYTDAGQSAPGAESVDAQIAELRERLADAERAYRSPPGGGKTGTGFGR